jgi:hypothetical protein
MNSVGKSLLNKSIPLVCNCILYSHLKFKKEGDVLFLSCPSVRHTVVHITRKFWSPEFCGSYAPLNLEISQNLLLKQLVSATPLKLLNRISWNLVGSKDTICSCAYYQKILIAWSLWELCPFEHRNFPKFTTVY